ncbi:MULTISPECIES: hypothetical protein [unclassified Sphingobium]|uniref:hypothetical protein n=1 Tax=unclassified Sphingobium TaxID=2611147 RepID=UPI0022241481|nr:MULTISPECIES: hypothetical protein [unclassified Sphingobium]MCW2412942.1 hypothetical protein [Sphingobium sp. B8D3D]MCW2414760.1 hypothetical protein [Sphingobium sp. B8D3A]
MAIVFYILAIWFGVWQSLVEPSLPGHIFDATDAQDFLIGYICLVCAGIFAVRSSLKRAPEEGVSVTQLEWHGALSTIAFSYFAVASAWGNFDADGTKYIYKLVEFAREIGAGSLFNKGHWLSIIGHIMAFMAYVLPLLLRAFLATLIYLLTVFIVGKVTGAPTEDAYARIGGWGFGMVLLAFGLCFLFFDVLGSGV